MADPASIPELLIKILAKNIGAPRLQLLQIRIKTNKINHIIKPLVQNPKTISNRLLKTS